jgi:NADH dehydrogenase
MHPRIVIVGAGFAGLETALSLKSLMKHTADITVIDRNDHQSFLPSIHEVISGKVRPEQIKIPLPSLLKAARIAFLQDEVRAVETNRREVHTAREALQFDYLVLACGAAVRFYQVPGAREFAHAFRTPEQADQIGNAVRTLLEGPRHPARILIAGGGLEGVEIAGELLDLVRKTGRRGALDSGDLSIELIEAAERLLPGCSERVQHFVEDYLENSGARLVRGSAITEIRKDGLSLASGETREMSMLIWTGGIQPPPWIRDIPLAKDTDGWLQVTGRLHSPDDDHIYAVGDIISFTSSEHPQPLAREAHYALDQARVAALNIYCDAKGYRKIGYHPPTKPQAISLGKAMGVLASDTLFYTGPWVVRLKKLVEKRHLVTYRARPYVSRLIEPVPGAEMRHLLRLLMPI